MSEDKRPDYECTNCKDVQDLQDLLEHYSVEDVLKCLDLKDVGQWMFEHGELHLDDCIEHFGEDKILDTFELEDLLDRVEVEDVEVPEEVGNELFRCKLLGCNEAMVLTVGDLFEMVLTP